MTRTGPHRAAQGLSVEQLRACRDAVSFAGYPYFAARGEKFLNGLMDALGAEIKAAGPERPEVAHKQESPAVQSGEGDG